MITTVVLWCVTVTGGLWDAYMGASSAAQAAARSQPRNVWSKGFNDVDMWNNWLLAPAPAPPVDFAEHSPHDLRSLLATCVDRAPPSQKQLYKQFRAEQTVKLPSYEALATKTPGELQALAAQLPVDIRQRVVRYCEDLLISPMLAVCFHLDTTVLVPSRQAQATAAGAAAAGAAAAEVAAEKQPNRSDSACTLLSSAVVMRMADLRSGDTVLVADPETGHIRTDRVSINLHVRRRSDGDHRHGSGPGSSRVQHEHAGVTLHHASGSLSVTDAHIVFVFVPASAAGTGRGTAPLPVPVPARKVKVGDLLRVWVPQRNANGTLTVRKGVCMNAEAAGAAAPPSEAVLAALTPVTRVSRWRGGIVNAVTHSGRILAGGDGATAATAPTPAAAPPLSLPPAVGFALSATVVDSPLQVQAALASGPSLLKLASVLSPGTMQGSALAEAAVLLVCRVSHALKLAADAVAGGGPGGCPSLSFALELVGWAVSVALFAVVDVAVGAPVVLLSLLVDVAARTRSVNYVLSSC